MSSNPTGARTLPAEPTRAMLDAWSDEMRGHATHRPSTQWPGLHYSDNEALMVKAYQAMLNAAPQVPESERPGPRLAVTTPAVAAPCAPGYVPWDLETVKQEIRDLFARYGSGDYTPTEEEKEIIENALDEILTPPPGGMPSGPVATAAFNAAIDFALDEAGPDGLMFLECWREGAWPEIAEAFPEFKGPLPSAEPTVEPIGYAVVMENGEGPFVGCYRVKDVAEACRDRQPEAHNDVVVPVYAAPSAATGWKPTPEHPHFDEEALRAEIARVWGEHGAHADVYGMLLRDAGRYRWLRLNLRAEDRMIGYCVRRWAIETDCSVTDIETHIDASKKGESP